MVDNAGKAGVFLLASAVLLILAKFYLPLLSLVALSPFFVVFKSSLEGQVKPIQWIVLSSVFFILVFLAWSIPSSTGLHDVLGMMFYGFTLTLAVSLFFVTNKFSKNRLGIFTILLFWLGYDYLVLELYPQCSIFFLANVFNHVPLALVGWSHYTGFMGITAWILIANLLFYYVFFKDNAIFLGKIRWLSLVYTLILISIPIMIHIFFLGSQSPITWQEMTDLYVRGVIPNDSHYAERGEWVGRTAAWVSVLILTYSLVKQKVK